jgi:hypothetical protein
MKTMCLWASYKKKIREKKFTLESLKKRVGSISQRYGSGDPDPDPHQNVTDPQQCIKDSPKISQSLELKFLAATFT